jgi:leucyl-tRNA synthetase
MKKYNPIKIERKWQKYWKLNNFYKTKDNTKRKNYMLLTEFPYPSGNLHVGHWYAFALPDILARYLRMKGYNVLYPIGFDAFGLPAENAAIKRNINPRVWTEQNIKYMTKQLKSMGASFDWSRQVSTIDPAYYKWTQWLFLKLYEKGLAYRAKTTVNWCPKDKTVLANEQVVNNCCERCGSRVTRKELVQWMLKITEYADKLYYDLDNLDWPETTKLAQKNWIGRSEGAIIKFKIYKENNNKNSNHVPLFIEVFTTRPDTINGVTFMVISPELAKTWLDNGWKVDSKLYNYVISSLSKREIERQEAKEKTGINTGLWAINPFNNEKIPIWISDYVLGNYGTGAIMAVPAYDERDKEFAEKFNLSINYAPLEDAQKVLNWLEEKKIGNKKINYRLRDWVISRQRYWGVPIPVVYCIECGYLPVAEKDLPVKLPQLDNFKPANDGRSPLAKSQKWLKTKCVKCGKDAERETDTMDTFVDSSWYFIRYADPKNNKEFASKNKMSKWLPVPMYVGGAEHNTMHLLYSRFFIKALYDLGYVDFSEPFIGRRNHGTILGPDGQKMSKSRGNVIDPDKEVAKYGADTLRLYLAFMGPYELGGPWSVGGINGVYRFLNKVWHFIQNNKNPQKRDESIDVFLNKYIKEISHDIENMKFNTGVSGLMKLLNSIENKNLTKDQCEVFLKLLFPFAPHIAEELWHEVLGNKKSINFEKWPEYKELFIAEERVNIPVQINGKLRDVIETKKDISEDEIKKIVLASDKIKKHIEGREIKKIIYIKNKLVNLVI